MSNIWSVALLMILSIRWVNLKMQLYTHVYLFLLRLELMLLFSKILYLHHHKCTGFPVVFAYLDARNKGIQQPASRDCAASSITTKSKWSCLTSLRGPSDDALVLVARTTSALVRISVTALSSLCFSSPRKDFISCLRCFFSDWLLDFLTFDWWQQGTKRQKE